MTDFVLEQSKANISSDVFYFLCSNYVQFLKQPLTLGMFVPCDEEGNIMDINSIYDPRSKTGMYYPWEIEKAKERVLFEGAIINGIQPSTNFNHITINGIKIAIQANDGKFYVLHSLSNIEKLQMLVGGLTLTPQALKQIGICISQ